MKNATSSVPGNHSNSSMHWMIACLFAVLCLPLPGLSGGGPVGSALANDDLTDADIALIKSVERQRIKAIDKVIGSVIAIYDENRKGGGSGVIIDPSGIALTNHHVIMGAGVHGWGGLADGKMYKWKLIGTDPGGDVSIIQMEGKDEFPFTPLGDSDLVQVGDWAMAMGNPFILTEDQSPTVTLGIVSGVKRYQYGAGKNQLVYGNCIQVDSSINPGNSGGPLFNLHGEVIGINGRGSFQDRGRVNVGLGYAISSNQIKNFIPDLLATKLVEHATLDASFSDRDGKVVCSTLNLDAPIAAAGLELGDELLEFEGTIIKNANQFTNLICTIPEDWPTELKIRKKEGDEQTIAIRTFGLPYSKPRQPPNRPNKKRSPDEEQQLKRQREMIALLAAEPGEIRHKDINRRYAEHLIKRWKKAGDQNSVSRGQIAVDDELTRGGKPVGSQSIVISSDGRFRIQWNLDGTETTFLFDGKDFHRIAEGKNQKLSLVQAKLSPPITQAIAIAAGMKETPFKSFGNALIDGSDKSQKKYAYRMRLLDDDDDEFFFWLQEHGEQGLPGIQLSKVAPTKDLEDAGGVIFDFWKRVGPFMFPANRTFVEGLAERPSLHIQNQSAKWMDSVDESLFVLNDANEIKSQESGEGPADGENEEDQR